MKTNLFKFQGIHRKILKTICSISYSETLGTAYFWM